MLPLGHRVAEKIKRILREELDAIDGMEVEMPVLNPAEIWKKTGRYYDIGQELFRIKDRKDREFVLAMTHEEVITDIARQFMRSYRDLPVMLYQIQTKIRDEARPDGVLAGVRRALRAGGIFLMQDIRCSSHLENNLEHPLAPLIYTISCMHCMSVSLAAGGPGLGAVWGKETALRMLHEAGFRNVCVEQLPHDALNYYYLAERGP